MTDESCFPNQDGGLVVVRNSVMTDIHFTSEMFGTFNITRALKWAREHPDLKWADIPRDTVAGMLANIDHDQGRLRELREQLTFEPLLAIAMADGTSFIIDGYHRLQVLYERHRSHVLLCVIPIEHAEQFRVRYYLRYPGKPDQEISNLAILQSTFGRYTDTEGRMRT